MAATLLLKGAPLLHRHRLTVAACFLTRRPSSTAPESTRADENAPASVENGAALKPKYPQKFPRLIDPDYRKWKIKEDEIVRDIEPIILLTKEILHSHMYMDGERLTAEDEKAVVKKLLAYHPHSEDKIGCGLDSIMVDRHPQFGNSRCLFVVRSDGGWIDFSYKKCLRAYIRLKYPSHAERFIRKHFKRSSD